MYALKIKKMWMPTRKRIDPNTDANDTFLYKMTIYTAGLLLRMIILIDNYMFVFLGVQLSNIAQSWFYDEMVSWKQIFLHFAVLIFSAVLGDIRQHAEDRFQELSPNKYHYLAKLQHPSK